MKVHPAISMKKKERENLSHPTRGNIILGLRRPNAAAAGRTPTRTSDSSILSLTGYPEKFMKTKERENAIDVPLSGLGGNPWARIDFSTSCPVSRDPCPMSRFTKNEGASGDVYENKGTGKFLTPNTRKYTGGSDVRTPWQQEGPRPALPTPRFFP